MRYLSSIHHKSGRGHLNPDFVYDFQGEGGEKGLRPRASSWCGSKRVAVVERKVERKDLKDLNKDLNKQCNNTQKNKEDQEAQGSVRSCESLEGEKQTERKVSKLSQQRIDLLFD